MAAAAVPAISMGAQYFMNRGKNKKIAAAQTAGTTGLQDSSSDLSKFGDKIGDSAGSFLGGAQKQFGAANNTLDQAGNYFSPLLRGGRAAIDQSLAPDRAAVTETYRGAGKAIEQSGMRGGTRDLANAELNRDKAGKLALLAPAARANAAGAMVQLGGAQGSLAAAQAGAGSSLFNSASAAKAGSNTGYGTLLNSADRREANQDYYANQSGSSIGSMIFDAMKSKKGGLSGSKSGAGTPPYLPGSDMGGMGVGMGAGNW